MTLFLDFDRTLFDNERFFPYLRDLPALTAYRERIQSFIMVPRENSLSGGTARSALWGEIDALYSRGAFSFTENELAPFLFSDTIAFLQRHGAESVILTAGGADTGFQRGKVYSTGAPTYVLDTIIIPAGGPKAALFDRLLATYPPPYFFVDDLPVQLDAVSVATPQVACFEMRRDGTPGCGKYPVVHNLAELEASVLK